ncbi:hypothetical protein ASPBRDRAFT_79673 [Aspergillus brasiliensis CBS 101740]|uniref:Sulfotransferase domain-containing protein n=1 Tax=Aspergillus brasiliensis (strain CBS 101740 / IMI 381727 / IBT 21946) TaxID=767769 RepID=A0A1L9U1Y2_ASPBC|nr:hypothetical protein ASPBRDRAFT_79673 [Aspergillus brasiliensis CBS 101740]
MLSILKHIYPLPEPQPKRSRPLRVICLGLPRCGTDSLKRALETLGFGKVAHGFEWWLHHPNHSVLYCELILLKLQNRMPSPDVIRECYFDRLLGDMDASTDVPAVWFASELLQAYPDAKVILNRRRDIQAWKKSFRTSVLLMMQSWLYWIASWFNAELFWGLWLTRLGHQTLLFNGDFERNAEKAYRDHYEGLELTLKANNRDYLDWSVDDGWAPLCSFLDLPVPNTAFPRGNIASEFIPKLMTMDKERLQKAKQNGQFCFSFLAILAAGCWLRCT